MKLDWIAVDWGTSNLRIWAMDAADQVLLEKRSTQGMGSLRPEQFETVLLSHIDTWLGTDSTLVLACGMVGARQGWIEAPYASVPTAPMAQMIRAPVQDPRIDVRIISGVSQSAPADVIRGEETQIAGFLAHHPDYQGTICLPGTHSKWVNIQDGQITQFQTVLTGELFALLSGHSVLRHSLGTWDDICFTEVVKRAFDQPEQFAMRLFEIRAKALLDDDNSGIARLSATLIGTELAATQHYWREKNITIIGAGELARLYGLALSIWGTDATLIEASTLTLKGLNQAKKELCFA